MKKTITPLFLLLVTTLSLLSASAQTGIGTTTPNSQAILDITSTQKGLLLPRLTAAQQSTLASTLTSAQTGMLVRDSITGKALC
jgi:hypothetical protein